MDAFGGGGNTAGTLKNRGTQLSYLLLSYKIGKSSCSSEHNSGTRSVFKRTLGIGKFTALVFTTG